jgi:iron complex outermembrane recepter protein
LRKRSQPQNLAQNPQLTRVTGLEVKQTPSGLQVILKTPPGQTKLVPLILPEGNNLLVEILDATLAFSIRNGVTQTNPAPGISQVKVAKIDATSIRVTITGATQQPPTAAIVSGGQNLVLNVTPKATAQTEADEEIEIVVTGEREEDNYAAPNSNVGTRTDAAIKDVPQSIQVIPQQVIKDQGITELNDALNNVSGVSTSAFGQAFIRGFNNLGNIRSNGTSLLETENRGNFSLSNVEQIEVLKGPASVLYGSGTPGGTVNLTTKQPQKEPSYEIGGTIGNFSRYNPRLDLTGPLNEDKTILYRLNIDYQNTGSFVDFVEGEEISIFPVISFQLGKKTNLTLEGGYRNQNFRGNGEPFVEANSLPATGTLFSNPNGEIPLSRNLGERDFERYDLEQVNIGYLLKHQFSDRWSIRNSFRAFVSDQPRRFIDDGSLEADNRTLTRSAGEFRTENDNYALQTDLQGKFSTGIVKHDLLVGVELERTISGQFTQFFSDTSVSSIDIFEPEYGNIPDESDLEITGDSDTTSDAIGIYAQDLLSVGERVKVILGGRYDWVFEDFEDRLNDSFSEEEATAFAPRVGMVYQPIKPVSLYASWSRSFEPQFGFDRLGEPFVPVTGDQFDVGVKTDFLDNKLSTTLAVYQITRQNDFQLDPVDNNFQIQIGEQRSRGVEFDLTGEPLPGLRLIANYAYTDAIITEDTTGLEGTRINEVPEHSGGFWTVYELQKGSLKGLGFGTGVVVSGERLGLDARTGGQFTVPTQAVTNALIYYQRDDWKVQLNLDNLFDVMDVDGIGSSDSVFFGAPFTVRGQLSAEF